MPVQARHAFHQHPLHVHRETAEPDDNTLCQVTWPPQCSCVYTDRSTAFCSFIFLLSRRTVALMTSVVMVIRWPVCCRFSSMYASASVTSMSMAPRMLLVSEFSKKKKKNKKKTKKKKTERSTHARETRARFLLLLFLPHKYPSDGACQVEIISFRLVDMRLWASWYESHRKASIERAKSTKNTLRSKVPSTSV